ncbi:MULTISPECIES: NAD(P)-binding protein [unclassified Streptomyces]|uniref:NAD(P)-binding protein n=1 Tax=unclassified Streptomyces TaxID=2593676 RepID=UPI00081F409F|nr:MULTISPECIES: NAD(P)-binding protein [unclassified Streptomyces]MYR97931.1 NAD(P)-binding protein [Streptomyces sp. SID4937]SCE31949.1 Phytoene dehydrogenase-related protein [Streptomyces sp. ScaeMP-e83]
MEHIHRQTRTDVHVHVIGGGLAGLTAAITAAESGARVTLYEGHRTLGGRARTTDGPYRTNEGPHALYRGGPHWAWLARRDLLGSVVSVPPLEALRFRFRRAGALRRVPPAALLRLARRSPRTAPVDADFRSWAAGQVGDEGARAAAHFAAAALFHHDPGALSARFVQERLHRLSSLPPEARYPVGGWARLVDRMAGHARGLGVAVETAARVDSRTLGELARTGPVVVATSLGAARTLLDDASLTWESGRTVLVDLAVRTRRGDAFVLSDLDAPGWVERFTAQDPGLAPAGEQLLQGQFPIGPDARRAEGTARAEELLDLGFPGWRERTTRRTEGLADGRTGAVDRPGTTWRDRPAIVRGDGIFLAGDQVAAPGLLSEASFTSGIEAALLAVKAAGPRSGQRSGYGVDLNRT